MKIVLSLLTLLLVGLLGVGGYYVYQTYDRQTAAADSSSQSVGVSAGVSMGATKKPATPYEVPKALSYAITANHDTVAWIEIPDTDINDSVVQAEDNLFYERRNERKEYEVYGCYFMDYECPFGPREVLAPNTVIYGHSTPGDLPDGKRFSQLFRFTDETFAANHPCIYMVTPEERLNWEIFAVFYTDIYFDYIRVLMTGGEMVELANAAKEKSLYNYGIEIGEEDKILTLSTCSDKYGADGTHRFVVMARLLGEQDTEPAQAQIVKIKD
ncbi:MAG: class B sortase [Oscillospiraceae bacterium]|nr:class B sortase [Oscillospiraceae bacterium]